MDPKLHEEVQQLHAGICGGLADPNRILILYTLADRPYYVSELADALNIPQPTVSRHLRMLREKNLVTTHREGPTMVYRLADERIIQALDILRTILADMLADQGALAQSAKSTFTDTE